MSYDLRHFLHFTFETLAFFIGYRCYISLKKNTVDPISDLNRLYILVGAIFGGLIGSRLIGGLESISTFHEGENIFIFFYAHKTIVGGLLGGLIGVELIKKIIGEKKSSGDLITIPIFIGLIIGRIGCFFMGPFEGNPGVPTQLPWGLDQGDGIIRHPVMLYEILFLILLGLALKKIKIRIPGELFKIFMASYLFFRFSIEFLKDRITAFGPLSIIQSTCLLGIFYYVVYFIRRPKIHTKGP